MEGLDAMAVASGPGQFTGIRIGMSYAAVAAWQLKIPALAVTRFEAAAHKIPERLFCVVLAGYREDRLYQTFRRSGSSRLAAESPGWTDGAHWPETETLLETRGAVVHKAETSAADLLIPAQDYMRRGRKPRFEPLYLKPAGYEKKRR